MSLVPLLRNCVHRQTLIVLRNILRSIHRFFTPFLTMFSKSTDPQSSSPDPPPFDPTRPSVPISYPIKTLEDLESRSYFESFHYPFNRSSVSLQVPSGSSSSPDRPKILVCHDMAGGYLDDKWVQGGSNEGAYAIWHWYLIDVFVYFAHSLVTLPPPCWTNTAHKHGVKVLGTFITEWDEGRVICNKLLATKESTHMYAERLAELAAALGFDGWLINMEVELDVGQIPNMKEFVGHLTKVMHSSVPGSLVIWYDSVTIEGKLEWQNQLNENNKPFFDLCDGIFINYTWKEEYPKRSAAVAGERKHDVYMGIDVFGRNTYGGGEWNTHVALDLIKKDAVSAAIFAPGWVYETKQPPDFETAQNRWWSLVEKSWGVVQNYPKTLPFYSNFDQGHGYHISIDGIHVSGSPWCNISSQGFQPLLEFTGDPAPAIQVLVNFKEPSYSGGGNITFKGTLGDNAYSTTRLFLGKLLLGHLPVHFTYSVKSDGNSLVGLSLEFSSSTHKRTSVLLASRGNTLLTMNQFSSKFDKIIMPNQVKQLDTSPGWVLQESSIAMNRFTLTEIHAVCYRSKPERAQLISPSPSLAEFTATLGHVTITTSKQNLDFPPSSSWIVEDQYVKWVPSPQDASKSLSVKITWKLKSGGGDSVFPKYNIYVEKLADHVTVNVYGAPEAQHEYLGVAQVRAFYVSDLVVPAGTSGLKFVIQVCGVDGSVQKLGDSPFLQLDIQA